MATEPKAPPRLDPAVAEAVSLMDDCRRRLVALADRLLEREERLSALPGFDPATVAALDPLRGELYSLGGETRNLIARVIRDALDLAGADPRSHVGVAIGGLIYLAIDPECSPDASAFLDGEPIRPRLYIIPAAAIATPAAF